MSVYVWTSQNPKVVLSGVVPDTRINLKSDKKTGVKQTSDFIWTPEFYFFIFIKADWRADLCFCKFHRSVAEFGFLLWFKFSARSGFRIFIFS